ncbi:lazarillo protein-like [Galleria mellonella]|uniref:Lazarillo protein-like n=1 Tax=Galleria mellonella TaxID=7137 RepID=A0ABM3MYZ3_GALME|nr:lazarillo protein-like [Galleria mellonella]
MLLYGLFVCLCALSVESVVLNTSCPVVSPRELDWKALDGKWYIAAAATDLPIDGADCATLMFNHMNSTDVSISWVTNNTASYYNGSVAITVDPNSNGTTGDLLLITYTDQKAESYSFLDVDYEHYAVLFTCYDSEDGNSSTYEIWKLIRSPHLKESDAIKLDQAIANYSLQDTTFINFNNTEDACSLTSGSQHLDPSTLILTSAVAYTLFNKLY